MIFVFIYLLSVSICLGQTYEIKTFGLNIAIVNQKIINNKIIYSVKSDGLFDFFWPFKNYYSSVFDSTNYNIINLEKKISQENYNFKLKGEIDSLGNLIYNKDYLIKLNSDTKNIFSLFAMIQRKPYFFLDTKWFNYEHEGNIGKARFLWADSSSIWNGNDSILCDHYRLDIKITKPLNDLFKESDYFMKNIINENMVREFWVSKKKPNYIVLVSIKNETFPIPLQAVLKESLK